MIQSLDRGMQVLDILAAHDMMSVTEIAKILNVDKSTVSRIIDTLKAHDMVQVDRDTGKYRLGFRVLHLGEALRKNLNVLNVARPILSDVCHRVNESVHLCTYNNNMVYVIEQVRSEKVYNLAASVGMIEPFHCSSVGKCILAYRRPVTIDTLLQNYDFKRYTQNTITSKDELLRQLSKIKTDGYAVDNEEMALGVRCIAAPIFNYRHSVRYSIGISGPVTNITEDNIQSYIKVLVNAAKRISRAIGCDLN